MKIITLKNAARGMAFDYAGQTWIKLEETDGRALCLSNDIVEKRAFDEGNRNNFAVSSIKEYLNGPYLDNLIDSAAGPNAFLQSELDLTTDDGLKDYGTCTATIFLLTVDQYRRNRDVIPNADDCWWLSTAFSTEEKGYKLLVRTVRADGTLSWYYACTGAHGLRPACYLDSNLLICAKNDETTKDSNTLVVFTFETEDSSCPFLQEIAVVTDPKFDYKTLSDSICSFADAEECENLEHEDFVAEVLNASGWSWTFPRNGIPACSRGVAFFSV